MVRVNEWFSFNLVEVKDGYYHSYNTNHEKDCTYEEHLGLEHGYVPKVRDLLVDLPENEGRYKGEHSFEEEPVNGLGIRRYFNYIF